MSKIIIGAPSLSGKDANELVAVAFKGAAFPLSIIVASLITNSLVFPEVEGLFLNGEQSSVVVVIKDNDQLQRLASSIEQVAELNRHESMLTIEALVIEPELVVDVATDPEIVIEPALDAVIEPELVTDPVVETGKKAGKAKAV
jgi:hypothetical protein